MPEQGYIVKTPQGGIRTFTLEQFNEAQSFALENSAEVEDYVVPDEPYDPAVAAQASIKKGREIAEYMLLELNTRAKAYKQATGNAIGSGLITLNSNLENFLNKGALDPDAVDEIERIVDTGNVDNFLDVYAQALLMIDDFLGGE